MKRSIKYFRKKKQLIKLRRLFIILFFKKLIKQLRKIILDILLSNKINTQLVFKEY